MNKLIITNELNISQKAKETFSVNWEKNEIMQKKKGGKETGEDIQNLYVKLMK